MTKEVKKWDVEYSHDDGRSGTVEVETEVRKSDCFSYGNGKSGGLTINGHTVYYDLRYNTGDLHKIMLIDYFGKGLVKAKKKA